MGEIRDMKSCNKSNLEPEINNFLFDPNESLIVSQNEEIKSFNNKKISKIKISLIKVILVVLIIHEKTKFPGRTIHQT